MKSKLQFFKKVRLVLIAIAMLGKTASGDTYTAVTSGNWSSSATWGGTVPSFTITSDRVNIPVDLTVTLDQNLTIDGEGAVMDVMGALSSSADMMLSLGLGNIVGNGTINVGNMDFETGSDFLFVGSVIANNMTSAASSLLVSASVTINSTFSLTYGAFTISTGGGLQFANNSTIILSGGALFISEGTLGFPAQYNVDYRDMASFTGMELTGSGLNNVTVEIQTENSLSLKSDLTVNGTLSLKSGTLVLNGKNLTVKGDIAALGSGLISSTSGSDVSINTAYSPSGSIQFSPSGNLVNNFTVNITTPGSSVTISPDLNVNASLNLVNGNINVGNNSIQIGASGSISGGNNNSYVIASGSGFLSRNIAVEDTGWVAFPIGTTAWFAPASVQLNAGSSGGVFQAGITTGVLSDGTTGTDLSTTLPLVDATWHVESNISAGLDMNLKLMWPSVIEVNGFVETSAYIAHYTAGNWDVSPIMAATAEGGGMFSLERKGINSLSPFAIFNQSVATGIIEKSITGSFELYPNPASSNINVRNILMPDKMVYVDIFDEAGRILGNYTFTGNEYSLPLDKLSAGTYYMKLYNDKESEVKKFVKIEGTN